MTNSAKWNGTLKYLAANNLILPSLTYGACNNNCNNNGICLIDRCVCYGDYKGSSCEIEKFIDFYECGYKCTFDQGICILNKINGLTR